MEEVVFPQRKKRIQRYENVEDIPLCKIWKIRVATFAYGDVFEQYYKVEDSLDKMKQEIVGIVEKIEKEEKADEKEIRIATINALANSQNPIEGKIWTNIQMKKREEARKKAKEKIAVFLEEFTNVLNSLNTLHIHLSSISGTLEELANIVDPNHDIEF